MLINATQRVFVYSKSVDFRKGHHGLRALVNQAGLDLWQGDVVVFFSRCRRKAKVLTADDTGVWMHYKQMSRGSFAQRIQGVEPGSVVSIRRDELNLLLSGSRYQIQKEPKMWRPPNTRT